MAEFYRDNQGYTAPKYLGFDILGGTFQEARFERNGETVAIATTSPAIIPQEIISLGGDFTVTWTYTVGGKEYFKKEDHRVVTPVFTKASLVAWDPEFSSLSDDKIFRLENIIRSVIEHITGQKFNYEYKTIGFQGSGGSKIGLPSRLVDASGIYDPNGGLLDVAVYPDNDGWTLAINNGPTWVDNLASSTAPITNPWYLRGIFKNGQQYFITGYFGYHTVPEDISLAAKILAEDYGCDESLWRDRYLASIRAVDWRFDFRPEAFKKTGNVKVDQILEKYTLVGMAVV